jgi:CRISPR-associated protein Csb2
MDALAHQRRPEPWSCFSPNLVMLTLSPAEHPRQRLRLTDALEVVQRLREAILSRSDGLSGRMQALLSGHGPKGGPLQGPHLALFPLASVGRPHADGRIGGLALALPRDVPGEDRRQTLRAVSLIRKLVLGRLGVWNVTRSQSEKAHAWTAYPAGATQWSTVTPVSYDLHPKATAEAGQRRELQEMIARACAHAGLLEPREIIATQVSAHTGTPPAHAFPGLRRKDGHQRRHAHFILTFDRPVTGPVLLGAGRYRGYGVFRPLAGPEAGRP